MKTLAEALDLDLDELTRLHLRRENRQSLVGFYISALRHYLEGDKENLLATLARVEVRALKVKDETIARLAKAIPDSGEWRGELLFVLALCHEARQENLLMSRAYQEAARELEDLGARKKAVKALLNHVAAENLLHPKKKYLNEYQYVYRQAKKVKNFSTAGMALLNISHEYHDLGAHALALSNVKRAIALLERQKQGRSYFLAIAHRAFVLHDMGRAEEGRLDYESFLASPFADLKGIRETLDEIFAGSTALPSSAMPPPWKGKSAEWKKVREKLGSIEQRLLNYVSEKPREKMDIISYLYGDRLSAEVLERRFHNTISRIKKKCPGLIHFEKGQYRLSAEMFELRAPGKKKV